MVLAADDDFILHDALTDSVSFLEANPGLRHVPRLLPDVPDTFQQCAVLPSRQESGKAITSERAQDRVLDYMGQYIPPFYAVQRTSLLRDWYEALPQGTISNGRKSAMSIYMLARAKARILPIPYVVREVNYGRSEHNTEMFTPAVHGCQIGRRA
jgi:hypothetical protein